MNDFLSLLEKALPALSALAIVASGFWTVFVYKRAAKQEIRREDATLVQVAQEAAKGVIEELRSELNRQRDENRELRERVDHLEGELASVRKTHIAMIEAKDATIAVLNGQVKSLNAEIDALRRMMVKAGLTPPPRAETHFEVAASGKLKAGSEPLP